MSRTLIRLVPLGLAGMLVVASGCSSCQQSAPTHAPIATQGRLPRAPETPQTGANRPDAGQATCAVVADCSVEEGEPPLEVQFSSEGMCTDADGTFTWDFGDGSSVSHEQNPTHTYRSAGTYNVRVTLEDADNKVSDFDELPITVTAPQQ